MESIFSRYKNALVLMLVVLAQVVLLAMQVRRPAPGMPDGHNVRLWRYWVAALVTPPERLAHNMGLGVRGVWSNYLYLRHLREQNENLQAENDRLRLEQASLAEDARSGERLRAMLDFRGRYIDKTLPAQVIGTSGTDQAHVIYIDKGSKDGLRAEMPVITPDGVIGKIKNVFPNTSQVLLISDQTSGAGVMLQATRIRGVLKGDASGEPQMVNISPDDRIKPGEPVLTSGGDQIYPQGLPVGVVDRVVADPDTSYVNVIVKPDANLAKLEEVLVVTEISGKMPFSEEKDMMQSEVDAYAEKQRAADILSEKLPSLRNADVPEATLASAGETEGGAAATGAGGDPARPMRPPQPLHADRYTPGAAPAANILTPGQAPPGLHRQIATGTSDSATSRAAKPSGSAASGSGLDAASGEAALKSRFPPKPKPTVAAAAGAGIAGSAIGGSGAAGSNAGSHGAAARAASAGTSSGELSASALREAPVAAPKSTAGATGPGFVLPLQPAYPGAERRAASPAAESVGTAPVSHPARPATTAGEPGAAAPTASAETAVAKAPRPVGTPSGSAATGSHRILIPGDNGGSGILTPAGMGSFGASPRPRVAAPGGGTNSSGTPKMQNPATQSAPAAKSSGAPAKPAATAPPGGV